jgi:Tfp pilus assembly protein PilE
VGASSVLTVGVLASVAIPAFLKYVRRARAAEGLE